MTVYFCDSRSPWKRGSNENANGCYANIPQGTSLNTYTPDHLRAVEYEINNRPRYTLEDRSPAELFTALLTSPDHQLFFAAEGYRALALSLRGHGMSSNSKPPRSCSIADYVQDVCSVAAYVSQTPVMIGHSLGGFVLQKYSGVTRRARRSAGRINSSTRGRRGGVTHC